MSLLTAVVMPAAVVLYGEEVRYSGARDSTRRNPSKKSLDKERSRTQA
jgi:hypothetical protein